VNRIKRFPIAGKLRNCCLQCEPVPIAAVNLRLQRRYVAARLAAVNGQSQMRGPEDMGYGLQPPGDEFRNRIRGLHHTLASPDSVEMLEQAVGNSRFLPHI
jgi:hypothetical protein